MKAVLVEHSAALAVVSDPRLQGMDFAAAATLVRVLRGEDPLEVSPGVLPWKEADVLYLMGKRGAGAGALVLDLQAAPLFADRTEEECLVIFQRLLRFAIKYWENLAISANEHWVGNPARGVVFPFPKSFHSGYRITLEKLVSEKRVERRNPGKHLFAFTHGNDEGRGSAHSPDDKLVQKALEGAVGARSKATAAAAQVDPGNVSPNVLRVTELPDLENGSKNSALRGYAQWLNCLTKPQSEFVTRELRNPERLEGPAGSGKTLCLALRAVTALKTAERMERSCALLFVTHGEAMRATVVERLDVLAEEGFHRRPRDGSMQSLTVTTLQSLCSTLPGMKVAEHEFLDQDAMEAKQIRLLYVLESLGVALDGGYKSHRLLMSEESRAYFDPLADSQELRWAAAEMLQHEIGVIIKGRADESWDVYRELPRLNYGLPLANDGDRGFVFQIFREYKARLKKVSQFDTDDIVLSAIGQLQTPIWRRRREHLGYDGIYVDETHLFNFNELAVLHNFTRDDSALPIAFSVDRSQAPGDRGLTHAILEEAIAGAGVQAVGTSVKSVFRSSEEITALAESITASGATLFVNHFENPLLGARTVATYQDERRSAKPTYEECQGDDAMVERAYSRAADSARSLGCPRSDVLMVAFSEELFEALRQEGRRHGGVVELRARGDLEAVKKAKTAGRFVVALVDYVGGLEFDAAVLVGVDVGRVPPAYGRAIESTRHFLSFVYHSRLYVAITRARYRVDMLGAAQRGPSPLLAHALSEELVERVSKASVR